MLAIQSVPYSNCWQTECVSVLTDQQTSLKGSTDASCERSNVDCGMTLFDQGSAVFLRSLIRKYKRYIGDVDGASVCSGGLQQYLIMQHEKKQSQKHRMQQTGQEQSRFEQLPIDVKLHIFSYLTASDLCRASRVCQSWHDITEDNLLWAELMSHDITQWNVIGHNTYPALYKEVESEWSNKEIYLRCSPEVNKLLHRQNAMFSNISSMLRYFLPRKTPLFVMFGPGLESATSGIVRKVIEDSGFQKTGMFPGKFDGVGGGFTLKMRTGTQFHLSVMYSSSKQEREQVGGSRNERHRLMRQKKNSNNDDGKYDLVPAVQDFCRTVDGFIYVVDATLNNPQVESGLSELSAMVSERWSATHVPILVLSTVSHEDDYRVPCCEIVERLNLTQQNRPWQVRNCIIDNTDGMQEGLTWLAEQSHRK